MIILNFLNFFELIALLIFFFTIWYLLSRNGKLPPGPWGLPLLGYFPFLSPNMIIDFNNLSKKYGPVFSLYLGSKLFLVLNDFDSTSTIFRKKILNGRPDKVLFMSNEVKTYAEVNGEVWNEQRRFLINEFRKYIKPGDSTSSKVENILKEQSITLIAKIREICGQPTSNLRIILGNTMTNVTNNFINGEDFIHDEIITVKDFNEYEQSLLAQTTASSLTLRFPMLSSIFRNTISAFRRMKVFEEKFEKRLNEQINYCESIVDRKIPENYIESYLSTIQSTGDKRYSKSDLNGNCQLMLAGGSSTVRTAFEWLILCLAEHQDVQERIYQEQLTVFGSNYVPSWKDRYLLPYTTATVHESMRYKTIVPINPVRSTLEDMNITSKNYFVPKGTIVLSNNWAINHDPNYWSEPSKFKPEHYLNDQNQFKIGERFASFSMGKRNCPGKELAVIQLFYFTLIIIQKFKILPPEGGVMLEEHGSLVLLPLKPFVHFENRFA